MVENKSKDKNNIIIKSNDINKILVGYRIGKKPLAKLLGWGETTIIRYIDGDIPTNEYSDKLWAILNNPIYYLEILTQNKDTITGVAYKKSRNAVLSKLMESKISIITQYIVNITNIQVCASVVQVMLYYAQGFSLAIYKEELFQDDYIITEENMPYLSIYKDMKEHGVYSLDLGKNSLSEKEKELIQGIVDVCNWYGPKALTAILAFERIALKITIDKNNNKIITKDTLKEYFNDIIDQYNIKTFADIADYVDQRMYQIKALIG